MTAVTLLAALLAAAPTSAVPHMKRLPSQVEVRVTDRSGVPVSNVEVIVSGPSERRGTTDVSGRVIFSNMKAGTHKLRAEAGAFITLEKEFTIVRGRSAVVAASMSPIEGADAHRTGAADRFRAWSIPDLAEKQLIGREPVKESPIGCSGLSEARLIQVRDPLVRHAPSDVDEMLYVVAGEGMLNVDGREQHIRSGWFSIIPRGTTHSVSRTGRHPVILLSMRSGRRCSTAVALAGDMR